MFPNENESRKFPTRKRQSERKDDVGRKWILTRVYDRRMHGGGEGWSGWKELPSLSASFSLSKIKGKKKRDGRKCYNVPQNTDYTSIQYSMMWSARLFGPRNWTGKCLMLIRFHFETGKKKLPDKKNSPFSSLSNQYKKVYSSDRIFEQKTKQDIENQPDKTVNRISLCGY